MEKAKIGIGSSGNFMPTFISSHGRLQHVEVGFMMSDSFPVRIGPIRYATAERFERPQPMRVIGSKRSGRGEICPQPPCGLEAVLGPTPDEHPQGEDCLNLMVTTPGIDQRARPVLVWLHGGEYTSGSGMASRYDAGRLSAQGDVVVVNVNYRLGALGYLRLKGISDGNFGLYDQIEALRWVQHNIASYGGSPRNVTVFGQAAGALSIRSLLETRDVYGLFRRIILQSAPLGLTNRSRETAETIGTVFAEKLGDDPRTAAVRDILRAQQETAAEFQQRTRNSMAPPFTPVEDVAPCRSLAAFEENVCGLDVMYGWNADDMSAFPREGRDVRRLTYRTYTAPWERFALRLEKSGVQPYRYRLNWRPAGSPLGATHGLELPLLLGTEDAWRGAAFLGTESWETVERLGVALRTAWAGFARTGTPDLSATAGLPVTWTWHALKPLARKRSALLPAQRTSHRFGR
jgi:para-nitrobenzyl esterase